MITRRRLIKIGAVASTGLLLPPRWGASRALPAAASSQPTLLPGALPKYAVAQPQIPLPGKNIPQFVDPLPLLSVAGGSMETIVAGDDEIEMIMQEFQANVMPSTFVPAAGSYTGTWVWGYRVDEIEPEAGTYIGPVIVATRGVPTQIRFVNDLPDTDETNTAWPYWTDQTLHWADPFGHGHGMGEEHYDGPIPAVPHLHGGEVPPLIDGGPDAWFTADGEYHGHAYYTKPGAGGNEAIYRYPNTQEAAPTWFHDHVLGITRLNVYAGLAGAYPIVDPSLELPVGLHPVGLQQGSDGPVEYLIPLVLQDRTFDVDGQLFLDTAGINPEHPYWVPEFVGDTIVVNGKVWPYLEVEPRRYRFLLINGSNARTYELFLTNQATDVMGPPIWQIATDGGYLDAAVKIDPNGKGLDKLVLMPGERADIIIDFAGLQGQTLLMRNTGRTPYPRGESPHGATVGRIVQIRVNQPFDGPDSSYDPASGTPLRPPMVRLVNPATGTLAAGVTADKIRQLTLNEVMGAGGPLEVLVNNTRWDGFRADGSARDDFTRVETGDGVEYFSELPDEGDTEVWEIVNLTADAHPIHTHLTQFQLINRQAFNVNKYNKAYEAAFPGGLYIPAYGPPLDYNTGAPGALGGNPDVTPFLQGPARPPAANEAGWKDTVIMFPGQVTRIAVRFAPTDKAVDDPDLTFPFDPSAGGHGYVWHCHIIDHEDNEMMRPYAVTPKGGANRTYVEGNDY